MAFRQTGNPIQTSTSANFRITNGPGLVAANGQISVPLMEENLAREMARMKMDKEK